MSNVVFGWRLQPPTIYHQIPLGVPASAADNALLDSPSLVVLGVSGMRDHGCETLSVIGWWYWDCQWDARPMGVRHCLLLAGGIGTVSGMRDHGCETLSVIGWWYWDGQWDARPWVWDIVCYWLVVLGRSVGCETMGVRHCLLLAGGIGTVSGMRDHGCETLSVIGWWYWDGQWDARPRVWDIVCYWLVVLGRSVGCETMGVRHCLLLAVIIFRDGVA